MRCSSRLSRLGGAVPLSPVAVAAKRHAAAASSSVPDSEQEVPDVVEIVG